jgi:predicted Zn-dependent peptidase
MKNAAALTLISSLMGYGQSSVLAHELRHKRGLVYVPMVSAGILRDTGGFTLETFTKQDPAKVIAVAREILEATADHFKPDDLDWVKRQYIGALARYNAEVGNRTGFILNEYIKSNRLGTPEDWAADIMHVTYEDIVSAARTYLRRDNSFLLTMGTTDPGEL